MRFIGKMLAAALLSSVAASGTTVWAADHGDAPYASVKRSGDLNDLYVFLDPNDNSRVAVILTLTRTLDGKGVLLHIGDGTKTDPINDAAQQEQKIQAAVEQGIVDGKKAVLLKAEKKVRLADLFRVANAAASEKLKLHVAVIEKDAR